MIGRFLEHSRIFVFGNGGKTEVYLGSADWIERNIYERVEVIFHVKEPSLRDQILAEVVVPYLGDTQKTRFLTSTGEYLRPPSLAGSCTREMGLASMCRSFW